MSRNVVLITIDSLRSDYVGHLDGEDDATPCIDSVAAEGAACTQAYANGIPTFFAFRSILGGRRSVCDDVPVGIPAEWRTLADIFDENGYNTAGFNASNPWLTAEFNYDSGFDTFVDFVDEGSADDAGGAIVELMQDAQHRLPEDGFLRDKLGLASRMFCTLTGNYPIESAEAVTERALEWLSARPDDEPFFLWVHYMDPHYPWTPASSEVSKREIAKTWHEVAYLYNNSDRRPDPSTVAAVRRLYASEVSTVDSAIGSLLDRVDSRGLRDETIVCVTSDHGTELGDHGGFSHGPNALYEEVVHVPLALSGPGVPETTITEPVQHVDIPTTLVNAADVGTTVPEVEIGWAGNDFLQQQRERALIQVIYDYDPAVEYEAQTGPLNALVDYPWKLHWNEATDAVALYDLAADPTETEDLSDRLPERVTALKEVLREEQDGARRDHRTVDELLNIRRRATEVEAP